MRCWGDVGTAEAVAEGDTGGGDLGREFGDAGRVGQVGQRADKKSV